MADVAKLLVPTSLLTTASVVLYTVSAATTTIVRNIHVMNTGSASATFSLGLNGAAGTAATQIYGAFPVPGSGAFDWSGFLVLPAGYTLQGLASPTNVLTITISGVEAS
jgi:hypothetical protein